MVYLFRMIIMINLFRMLNIAVGLNLNHECTAYQLEYNQLSGQFIFHVERGFFVEN